MKKQKHTQGSIIHTISPSSQQKSIINTLKFTDSLVFREALSPEETPESLNTVLYRNRYGFYRPDVTLWAFLSAGYSKARAKLPEDMLSNLVGGAAEKLEERLPNVWLWKLRH